MRIDVDDNIRLESTNESQINGLFDAIDKNREHLSTFLPWVNHMQSIDRFAAYIKQSEVLIQEGNELSFAIISNEVFVGRIGLHHINKSNSSASIGYWLTKAAEGKGIISKSCQALIRYGFEEMGLHRIEIKAAFQNVRSQAIPKALNFSREGVLRQAEFVNNEYLDLVLYSLLHDEFKSFR
ncbi:MAG: GNAT family N-acetyltransferase [Chitinophagaceae bacterium]|nr:MAG: GNAT family N-acetyltransferase [Chitinophagaceae bacterium]